MQGTFNSLATTTFLLQFYHSDARDPSGYGEGQYLFGDTLVTTDLSGNASFSYVFNTAVPQGNWVSATATDTLRGNTSEFCEAIVAQPVALVLTGSVLGGDLALEWNSVAPAAAYWVFGAANEPYFTPQMETPFAYRVHVLVDTTWSVSAGIGSPDSSWTYQVIAVDASDRDLARSNRIGERDYALP